MNTSVSLPSSAAARRTGLLSCFALAVLMHGAVLASIWRSAQSDLGMSGSRQLHAQHAMRITLIKGGPEAASIHEPAAPVTSAAIKPHQALHKETAVPASVIRPAKHEVRALASPALDAPLLIEYPDAPLPGGWLRMRVFMQFDAEGRTQTLLSDADPASAAPFVEAVRRGLSAVPLASTVLKRHATATSQCMEFEFDEGRPEVKTRFVEDSAHVSTDCLGAGARQTTTELSSAPSVL